MKRKIMKSLTIFIIALCLMAPAFIYGASGALDNVTDAAGLLTEDERIELDERAAELSDLYECDIIIVTVEDKGEMHIEDFAQHVYDEYDLGYGEEKSGIMLMISMAERDYDIMAHGYGNVAFTDYGKAVLENRFLSDLSVGRYHDSFSAFVEGCGEFLVASRNGSPIDISTDPYVDTRKGTLILLIAPLVIAIIIVVMFYFQMKSAKQRTTAKEYIKKDGFTLSNQRDEFLFVTTTRRKIEKSSSSGGGTSVNSRGSSHSSGKF